VGAPVAAARCVTDVSVPTNTAAFSIRPVSSPNPSAEAMTFDLFILRPLALACTVVGTAVYIVALPFNILTLNVVEPGRRLVVEPAKFTFTRDLGDLDNE